MYIYTWGKYNSDVFADAKILREAVFIDEQGFDRDLDIDEYDKSCDHLVMYDENNNAIATARVIINYDGTTAKVGRIVVIKKMRKNGLGSLLLKEAEAFAKKANMEKMTLGAQVNAKKFYLSIGYLEYGSEYLDENVPHINMEKAL